jgi:flagellar biosynthesis chaperone FliJ
LPFAAPHGAASGNTHPQLETTAMNDQRRKRLAAALESIRLATQQLEEIRDEEQEVYDNMPSSLQDGDKGQRVQNFLDEISTLIDGLDDQTTTVQDAAAKP